VGHFGSAVLAGKLNKGKNRHILLIHSAARHRPCRRWSEPRWRTAVARYAVWQVSEPISKPKSSNNPTSCPRPLDLTGRFHSRLRYRSQLRVCESPSESSIARRHAATIIHPSSRARARHMTETKTNSTSLVTTSWNRLSSLRLGSLSHTAVAGSPRRGSLQGYRLAYVEHAAVTGFSSCGGLFHSADLWDGPRFRLASDRCSNRGSDRPYSVRYSAVQKGPPC
jgi:hypothetical protein